MLNMDSFTILYVSKKISGLYKELKKRKISIIAVESSKEALQKITQGLECSLIIVNSTYCNKNEKEIYRTIKSRDFLKLIPIILLFETQNIDLLKFDTKIYDDVVFYDEKNIDISINRIKNYVRLYKYRIGSFSIKEEEIKSRIKQNTYELNKQLVKTKKSEYEIALKLGKAAEFRDMETGMHIKRMSHYSALLAKLYGLDKDEEKIVLYASVLHDVGKVGIPDKILLKPGRLSNEEFEIMKLHTTIGGSILDGSKGFPVIEAGRIIALEHHEKFDGTGYPKGLKKEEIHLYGRIVSIADVFDALQSKRVYKGALSLEKTIDIMLEGKEKHFDPELLKVFLDNIDKFLEIQKRFPDEDMESHLYKLDKMVY